MLARPGHAIIYSVEPKMVTILPAWHRATSALLDLLFPQRCIRCRREGGVLCASCRRELPRLEPPYCQKCGQPLEGRDTCRSCQRWALSIDGIRSALVLEGATREAIHSLKYRNLRSLAGPLAQVLAEHLASGTVPGEVLVPVPLHGSRLRQRGYNQAELLARELSALTGIPLAWGALVRVRNTDSQARTGGVTGRRDNVRGAFVCTDEALRGRSVLLIDDVCTTGATLDACARPLKELGAEVVWGLTVARERYRLARSVPSRGLNPEST